MLYLSLTGPHTPWVPGDDFKGSTSMGAYGDFVSRIDHAVYQITETLKSLDMEENTLVIFSSDNGAPWQEEDIQKYGHRSNIRRGQKRSEEHTSELQSLMRISYAVSCLKKK